MASNDMEADHGDETINDATNDDEHLTYNSGSQGSKPLDQWTKCWTPDGMPCWNQWRTFPVDALETGWGKQGAAGSGAKPPPPA
jgi:hypothetical protein